MHTFFFLLLYFFNIAFILVADLCILLILCSTLSALKASDFYHQYVLYSFAYDNVGFVCCGRQVVDLQFFSLSVFSFCGISCLCQKFAIWSLPGAFQFCVILSTLRPLFQIWGTIQYWDFYGTCFWSSKHVHCAGLFFPNIFFFPKISLFLLWLVHCSHWYFSVWEGCNISCSLF